MQFLLVLLLLIPLFLCQVSIAASGDLLWSNYYDREGSLSDWANAVAVNKKTAVVVGATETTPGGKAFSVRAYEIKTGALLWSDYFNREGDLSDEAKAVALSKKIAFVAGVTETAAAGKAFSIRAYDIATGALLWQNYYDREGTLEDVANAVAVSGKQVVVVGVTETTPGGKAFSVRTFNEADGVLLWESYLNREGNLWDEAKAVAAGSATAFVVGLTENTAGGLALLGTIFNITNGTLVDAIAYNSEGTLSDWANAVVLAKDIAYVVGATETTQGGKAFTGGAYDASTGEPIGGDFYDREGSLWDEAKAVAVKKTSSFAVGVTETTLGGKAFTVKAHNAADASPLWEDFYDREGTLSDWANGVALAKKAVVAAGVTETAARGKAFSVRAYSTNGDLLWQDYYDREPANKEDMANAVASTKKIVVVVGVTETSAGGKAFSVRAYAP